MCFGGLEVCCCGSAVAAFEHQDRDWDAEKDEDADEGDGWDASEVFGAHERDEDAYSGQDGERTDREEDAPLEPAVARSVRGFWGVWDGAGMRNRWTHHLGVVLLVGVGDAFYERVGVRI